jgi:pimeloyl-ACP methyl ester carboxylesterase
MQIQRTKFKDEIIVEFVLPKKITNKVMILCSGMPGYPAKEKYAELFKFYTAKGFSVFVPRYRGSWESGGKMFAKSPHLDILDIIDELPKGFESLWDGTKYKIENPEVYIIGSSFGGPAGLLNSRDARVKRVIVFSPVIDWQTMDETIEPIGFISKFVSEAFTNGYRIAKDGWDKIERGQMYNPMQESEKIDGSKCLVIHAKDDEVVSMLPLKAFIMNTGAELKLVNKGGHLGMAIMEKPFAKLCFEFIKTK